MLSINNASYALNFFCAIFFLLYLFGAFNPVDTNVYRVRDEIKCEEPVPCPKQSTESKTCAKEEELQSQLGEIKSLVSSLMKFRNECLFVIFIIAFRMEKFSKVME